MKRIKLIFSLAILLAVMVRCSVPDGVSQDMTVDKTATPTGLETIIDVTNDNSGNVTFTPSASGAGTFDVYFGDSSSSPSNVQFGASVTHKYNEGNYTAKVVARGLNGVNIEKTYPISLVFRAPEGLSATFTKNGHTLKVKASASYAASYLVYFGDAGSSETGTPLANSQEISHNYATAGVYNVKVVALSGGLAQTEKTTAVTITDPFEFPITFENPLVVYSFSASAGFSSSKVANPNVSGLNTTSQVGRFNKIVGSAAGAGTSSVLETPLAFEGGKNKIKVLAYTTGATNIGKKVTLELISTDGATVATLKVALTKSGAWEELVFDFGTIIPAIPSTTLFNKMNIRFNDISGGRSGEIFYLDEFSQSN